MMKATIEDTKSSGILYTSNILGEIAKLYSLQQKTKPPTMNYLDSSIRASLSSTLITILVEMGYLLQR